MNILQISLCAMLLVSPISAIVLPTSVAQAENPVFVGGLQIFYLVSLRLLMAAPKSLITLSF